MKTNPQVDAYFEGDLSWPEEMRALRRLCHKAGLDEAWKWRQACYTSSKRNVAVLQQFKDHCALGFFQGVLMNDPEGLLVQPTANSQSARKVVFRSVREIEDQELQLEALLREGARVADSGEKVKFKTTDAFDRPAELDQALAADLGLAAAFDALTPGRQRGYILHFAGAKKSSTRADRIARHRERILAGKGLQDR